MHNTSDSRYIYASTIKRGALERGLKTLRMDGVDKLLAGQTTPEEILRVTQLDVL